MSDIVHLNISIGDTAKYIEDTLADHLLPPREGYYLWGQRDPIMVPNKKYFQRINGEMVEIHNVDEINSAVYNEDGEVVFMYPPRGKLSIYRRPVVPTIGLDIIKEFADATIDSNLKWIKKESRQPLTERLRKYFRPVTTRTNVTYSLVAKVVEDSEGERLKYWTQHPVDVQTLHLTAKPPHLADECVGNVMRHDATESEYEACINMIRDILSSTREDLARFMGDDLWRIYSTQLRGQDLYVQKLADYRIHMYSRLAEQLKGETVYVKRRNNAGEFEYVPSDIKFE